MHAFLAVIGKDSRFGRQRVNRTMKRRMARAMELGAPSPGGSIERFVWQRVNATGALMVATDEPVRRFTESLSGSVATWTGYFAGPSAAQPSIAASLFNETNRDAGVGRLGGVYSLALIDGDSAQFHTTLTRVDPVYWCEDRRFVYVSSRALVAHLTWAGRDIPEYDVEALVGLISAGYFPNERTPFRGLRIMAAAHVLEVGPSRIVCRPRSTSAHSAEAGSVEDAGAGLANALTVACGPVANGPAVQCALTGGKDSRLLVAALRSADVDFTTRTYGTSDHPDVVVAQRLSKILGVEHINQQPVVVAADEGDFVAVSPVDRARGVLRRTEGMLSAYENVAPEALAGFSDRPVVGGHGGELLRGGFAHYATDLSPEGAVRFLEDGFLRYPKAFQKDAWLAYHAGFDRWLSRARTSPIATLDLFYLHFRTGRWAAAGRTSYAAHSALFQPFFDDQVVAAGRRAPIERRLDESLIRATLEHLAPEMVDVPFAEHRWVFERGGPENDTGRADWEARTPISVPTAPRSRFDWRLSYGEEVQQVLAEQVLGGGPADLLFDIVDRGVIERLLLRSPPKSQHLSWRLFTASVLLSGTWFMSSAPPARTVEVPLPRDL